MPIEMKNKKNNQSEIKDENPFLLEEPAVAYNSRQGLGLQYFPYSDWDMLRVIKEGIPKKAFDKTMQMMDFSLNDMSDVLHISERTLRRYDENTVLSTEQSERIVELNSLYRYGKEVFGSLAGFKQWVESPILALGNKKPREFLDTSIGIHILKTILGRIEYGVYS